jgi:tetratricopeptide (TPR) repeat protein
MLARGLPLAFLPMGCSSLPDCTKYSSSNPSGDNAAALIEEGDAIRDRAHRTLFKAGNWELGYCQAGEAEKYYRYVLEKLEPHNAYAMVNLGYLALMKAYDAPSSERDVQLGAAYARLREALQLRPGYAAAHTYLGEYYVLRKEYGKASTEYKKLLDSKIENSYIYTWAGYAAKKSGRATEAKQYFRQSVERGDRQDAASWARKNM